MSEEKRLKLELLSCPGDRILETIEAINMSVPRLAASIGLKLEEVERLLVGSLELTEHIAQKLEDVLSINKSFWVNLEAHYRKELEDLANMD